MAGASVSVTVHTDAALARLDALDAALANPADLLARVGEYLTASTRARFKTMTGPDGRRWRPLEPNYAKSKKYNRDKILTLRGFLRNSIHWQADGRDAVQIGTNLVYGAIHQHGGIIRQAAQSRRQGFVQVKNRTLFAKRKSKRAVTEKWVLRPAYQIKMWARPYLGVSDADERELQRITQDWLAGR